MTNKIIQNNLIILQVRSLINNLVNYTSNLIWVNCSIASDDIRLLEYLIQIPGYVCWIWITHNNIMRNDFLKFCGLLLVAFIWGSLLKSCGSLWKSCGILWKSCNSLSKSCGSLSKSCNSLWKSCGSLSKSCNSLWKSCGSLSKSCNSLWKSCGSLGNLVTW